MKLEDFLEIVLFVKQFDWGDFFLFRDYPNNWINDPQMLYPEVIAQTDTTIRAVDDTYIYVYTHEKNRKILNIIKDNYEIESIKTDVLENLDYPE